MWESSQTCTNTVSVHEHVLYTFESALNKYSLYRTFEVAV